MRQEIHIEGTIVHISGERDENCLAVKSGGVRRIRLCVHVARVSPMRTRFHGAQNSRPKSSQLTLNRVVALSGRIG